MTRVGSARRAGLGASAIAVVGAIGLVGCAAADGDSGPRVVVTTNILGDVASELVGDAADVTTLMKPNADPHSFEISAQEAATLQSAELVISNGLGLEEGVEQHLEAAADAGAPRFIAADHLETIPYAEKANGPDPHFWTDPARMIDVVEALETELGEIGIDVSANAAAYLEDLAELDAEMSDAFARIPNEHRALVTNHHVFGYLADRFDFEVIGAAIPGGTTLASPSAADLDELATAIDSSGVPAIFAESSQPDRLMQVLRSEADIDVAVIELFTESLTEPGGDADTYLSMMRENTERITTGLTSERTP
ncbi:MAG: zinc ABC transporter substrate-binding protein AztC [Microbacterium gubbeenense]|uniref:zinc ABC transporter substrate-binding protein AztC n=1 Tax=Microbacterium gubbeenense TaxID=159896 RepID=UPI003F9A9EA3